MDCIFLSAANTDIEMNGWHWILPGADIIKLLLFANELLVPACETKCMQLLKEVSIRKDRNDIGDDVQGYLQLPIYCLNPPLFVFYIVELLELVPLMKVALQNLAGGS